MKYRYIMRNTHSNIYSNNIIISSPVPNNAVHQYTQ